VFVGARGSLLEYSVLFRRGISLLSRVINGQAGISPEMAIRSEKAGWSNADQWLRVQAAYDLAQARRYQDQIKVKPYKPHRAA
jgi:plasmid maintenance system antidote protein VapI